MIEDKLIVVRDANGNLVPVYIHSIDLALKENGYKPVEVKK